MTPDFNKYFVEIEKRYSELKNQCAKESFILNLKSLSRWNNEPMDYPEDAEVEFPENIHIAHAVCHPECGVQALIVDGGPQKCQRCGGSLFRNDVVEYRKSE